MRNWYTASELAGLPGMPDTWKGVIRKAKKEKWEEPARGRDRGQRREFNVMSLPDPTMIIVLTADRMMTEPMLSFAKGEIAWGDVHARLDELLCFIDRHREKPGAEDAAGSFGHE